MMVQITSKETELPTGERYHLVASNVVDDYGMGWTYTEALLDLYLSMVGRAESGKEGTEEGTKE